jgi:hypothetical protein
MRVSYTELLSSEPRKMVGMGATTRSSAAMATVNRSQASKSRSTCLAAIESTFAYGHWALVVGRSGGSKRRRLRNHLSTSEYNAVTCAGATVVDLNIYGRGSRSLSPIMGGLTSNRRWQRVTQQPSRDR